LKEIKVQQFKFSQDLFPLHHHLREELKKTILYPLIDLNQVLFFKKPEAPAGPALSDAGPNRLNRHTGEVLKLWA
jgi:hypothetical protein